MKPIFDEERIFLRENGIDIPDNCWIKGKKIYLNADEQTMILEIEVVDNKSLKIKINNINKIVSSFKNKTIEEEILENKLRLDALEEESINKTIQCMKRFSAYEFRVSTSGGKDSDVCRHIVKKALEKINRKYNFEMDFFNTSNDTADTYKKVKKNIKEDCEYLLTMKLNRKPTDEELKVFYESKLKEWIHNPDIGWYQWIKSKNYYIPTAMVRSCCETYKEGELKKILSRHKHYVLFLGMRKYESIKRSGYDWYLNEAMGSKSNVPPNWIRFLPIVEWTDKDVWLYMLRENIEFNPMYKKGYYRVGCCICPYTSDYTDLLIKRWYPSFFNRWTKIVEKHYDIWGVEKRLKWSKEEFVLGGKWKKGISKEYYIINSTPHIWKIHELAKLKGCSVDVAKKFFKKKCSCGKKLSADEVAMYLKLYGRFEYIDDERVYLCRECVCKEMNMTKKEYVNKIEEFRNEGCNLF